MHPSPPAPPVDPKTVITPDALHMAPELLGLPLASPSRRAAAMAVDGLLVAILSNAPGFLLGLAAGLVLLRVSGRSAGVGRGRARRFGVRFVGAVVLFVMATRGWSTVSERFGGAREAGRAREGSVVRDGSEGRSEPVSSLGVLRAAGGALAFRNASDEAQAREAAQTLIVSLRAQGLDETAIEEALDGLAEGRADRPWLRTAAAEELERARDGRASVATDSLTLQYAAALRAGDQEVLRELKPKLADALGGAELRSLRRENRRLSAREGELREEADKLRERADSPDVTSFLRAFFREEFGLGLGWTGLYFVATVALFRGRTPGKRLLGIRVVRLNGKPMGWWAAFERFGGYAAGIATGLLGFFQILWDRNRQAIHDKIAETAVVRG